MHDNTTDGQRLGGLSDDWTTCAVTALPPGWINVYEREDDDSTDSGSLFFIESCPAVLLQERRGKGNERQTRVVAAAFEGVGGIELDPADLGRRLYLTTTKGDWEAVREESERDVIHVRSALKQVMLDRLRAAGDDGVEAGAMVAKLGDRACSVRGVMERDGLVTSSRRDNPAAIGGWECIYRLTREIGC